MSGNGVELVWEGKRREVERVALPFQRVELINESRATREGAPLFATGALLPGPLLEQAGKETAWRNKLIWGDNKYVLASLLEGDPSTGACTAGRQGRPNLHRSTVCDGISTSRSRPRMGDDDADVRQGAVGSSKRQLTATPGARGPSRIYR